MSNKRKTTPSVKYSEMNYVLVQFLEDNIKSIVTENQVMKEDTGLVKAMYLDKQYYSCLVLGESEDKDALVKMKNAMDAIAKKTPGGKEKENSPAVKNKEKSRGKKKENSPEVTKKQPGGKKEHLPVTTKGKSKEEKQAANEEKEEKKREKLQKKKALDERDFNVLSQLSKLNKAVVVVDEQGREIEEKDEMKRKNMELSRREKEVQRNKKVSNKENRQKISSCKRTEDDDLVFEQLKGFLSDNSNRNDDTDEEEDILNDSGLDLADDIDVAEATTLISVQRRTGTPSHPAVGMKRPRSRPTIPTANKCPRRQPELDCSQCRHLLAENRELKESNALLTEQLTQCRLESTNTIQQTEAPRPGKVPKAIAEKFHMIELSPGKGVYVYESHITKAYSKQTATATARFLLSCFYNDEELIGKSLTGKNGKQCLNGDILESILSYTRKRFEGVSDSIIRIAMRNKITCLEANAKKKRPVS